MPIPGSSTSTAGTRTPPVAEVTPPPELEDRVVAAALERRAATRTATPIDRA